MAKKTKSELKNYFQAGKRPTESQFEDFLDSYIHLDVSDLSYGEANTNTLFRDNAGASGEGVRSGFYQTSSPINYPAGASSWWHLLDVRHSNIGNNYAMQIAGSFFDQNLWYRKTSNDPTKEWRKIIASEANGNVTITGRTVINKDLGTNHYIDVAQHNAQFQIGRTSDNKSLEFAVLDNGTGIIQAKESSVGYHNLCINPHPNAGNIGIGTINPDQKLTVKGKIHAEDVIVDMNVPADYVFQKYYDNYSSIREDYSMMNLNDLEAFIKENKHLPEIPSGEKMTQDGVTLGDFQMKLLQKIEELTLYAISQNKEIEQLKSQINKQ